MHTHTHFSLRLPLPFALPMQVYERAIALVPPAPEKRYWQRYVYLWIKYALFEELEAGKRSGLY